MAIESVGYISSLNPDWPMPSESPTGIDDHARLIKQSLQNTFPNLDAEVTLTPDEMNGLVQGIADAVKKAGDSMSGNLLMIDYKGIEFALTEDDDVFGRVRGVDDRIDIDILDAEVEVLNTISMDADLISLSSVADGITPDGTSDKHLTTVDYVAHKYSVVRDSKPTGTHGGDFISGDWQVRDLNEVTIDEIGISVADNQITLPAGSYMINASAPAHGCNTHVLAFREIADTSYTRGSNFRAQADEDSTAFVDSKINITDDNVTAGNNVYELIHRCETSNIGDGFGTAGSFLSAEIYAIVRITRVI